MLPKFEIFGLILYSYPLILGLIWAMGWEYSNTLNTSIKNFTFLFAMLFISAWLGAKLLFLLTLEENLSHHLIKNSSFWMGGGFVFLGGLVAGLIVLLCHKTLTKQRWRQYEFLLLPMVLGHALGRLGCFFAGCCYGKVCDLPWAIKLHGNWRHPVQLYEAAFLFLIFFFLRRRHRENKPLMTSYLVSYLSIRFLLEYLRGDTVRGIYIAGLSTSQLISLGILGVIALIATRNLLEISKTS